jgi:hypothetical protein
VRGDDVVTRANAEAGKRLKSQRKTTIYRILYWDIELEA